jgi:D-lactate dehydrogenase (cytochrome)
MTDHSIAALIDLLIQALGPEHVRTDAETLRLMRADLFGEGATPAAVAAPGSTLEAARVVSAATGLGAPVYPRGGGMSYTGGYVADQPGGVVLDLRRMNRILAVAADDRTVTVEAGATWADLLAVLKPHGLRTPFWGPLSGLSSTLGGGLSQNNAFFGAGVHGPTADSVLSVTVVTATGDVVRTGTAGAAGAKPFFRHYGPDLTGLFLGDCGALGVKTEATLRLIPAPEYEAWASFTFDTAAAWVAATAAAARAGVACDIVGFDPNLARVRMKRAGLMADAGALMKVVGAQKSLLGGIKEGAKVALAGRGFLDGADYSLHAVVEGHSWAGVEADMARLRSSVASFGGKEVENTIPKVMRAQAFGPLNSILGPEGERWAPVHGIVAHSDAQAAFKAIEAVFEARAAAFERHGVSTGYLTTIVGQTGFLIEPVFYWPDQRYALHEATVEAPFLAKLPRHQANPEAYAVVQEARQAVVQAFAGFGAAHFQVGRAYPLLATRSPEMASLLRAVKSVLDPQGLMNPGALGL